MCFLDECVPLRGVKVELYVAGVSTWRGPPPQFLFILQSSWWGNDSLEALEDGAGHLSLESACWQTPYSALLH